MTDAVTAVGPEWGGVRLTFQEHVATLAVERPSKLNALTPEMLEQLSYLLGDVANSDARLLIVRGAPGKAFCVGADINRFAGLSPAEMWRAWTARGHRAFDALARLHQPTLAVLHGHAFGGGLELALACDFRVAAEHVKLGLPEVGLGTVPGWGGTERLTELVGRARAKEVVMARRELDAATALAWGVVTRVAPEPDLEAAVDDLADSLLAGAPLAIELAKQLIDAAAEGASSAVLEPLAAGITAATADLSEGIGAFRDRRPAAFNGA
jgi:enoyl-CoA hydratase